MKRSAKTGLTAGTAAILLGLTSLINGLQAAKRETCVLKVDYAHLSTHAKEQHGDAKIKVKARTECTKNQISSTISMTIYEVTKNGDVEILPFRKVKADADTKYPNKAYFESFEAFCLDKTTHEYFGKASGEVRMKSGKLIKVSGISEKSISLRCGIQAQ